MTGRYDPAARHAAARLQAASPGWMVLYGPWSRLYYAFPRFAAPPGTILAAPATRELAAWMRTTELQTTPGPPPRPGR